MTNSSSTRPSSISWACSRGPPSQSSPRTPRSVRRWASSAARSTPAVWRSDLDRGRGLRDLVADVGRDQDLAVSLGEQRGVPGQVESAGDDHHQRVVREPLALAALALLGIADHAPVALGAHRPRADHHRVGPRAQADQHRRVGLGADRTGAAGDRHVPIERQGEVGDHVAAASRARARRGRALRPSRRPWSRRRRGAVGALVGRGPRASRYPRPDSISLRCSTLARSSASAPGSPSNQASRISSSSASEVDAQAEREHVRVVPAPRARGGRGVGAERRPDARHLVGRDRRARAGPAADDRLLGAALGDVACGRLARPGPVVALALREGTVEERLVAALAQGVDERVGDAGPFVCRDRDSHRRDGSPGTCPPAG